MLCFKEVLHAIEVAIVQFAQVHLVTNNNTIHAAASEFYNP